MHLNVLAFAVPFFLFFIGLEYLINRKKRLNLFHFERTITNLNVGIAERLIDVFTAGGFYFVYDYLHQHFAIFDIRPSVLLWVTLLLCTDFLWYWYHRFGHEINLFWAAHVVHHQSEDFNLTAGARITIFQSVVRTVFWAVLPIIGFPAEMITTILLIHGLYPFFTHTQLVGKLGVVEYILVTPSHHRVHHASNECYLDKNYGDMFIIWDKLFGTFAEETEPATYGLTKPLESHSFLWQHFHFYVELAYAVRYTAGWSNKLRILFGSPAHFDETIRSRAEKRFRSVHTSANPTSTRLRLYVTGQVSITLFVLFGLLLFESVIPLGIQAVLALVILLTLINCGAILEQRRWVSYLEYARLAVLLLLLHYYAPHALGLIIISVVLGVLIAFWQESQQYYFRLVYGRTLVSESLV